MTYEELKAEVKRQGYNLVPKPEKVKALPCPNCGVARMNTWWGLTITSGNDTVKYNKYGWAEKDEEKNYMCVECQKCGFKGPRAYGKKVKEKYAIKAWNDYITKEANNG